MRKPRKTETPEDRKLRLAAGADERLRADVAEDETIDEMIRKSINLYGA